MHKFRPEPCQAVIYQHGRVLFTGTLEQCWRELITSYQSIRQHPTQEKVMRAGFRITTPLRGEQP